MIYPLPYRPPPRRPRALRLVLLLLAVLVALYAYAPEQPQGECLTDTECMLMHGGDGGPARRVTHV